MKRLIGEDMNKTKDHLPSLFIVKDPFNKAVLKGLKGLKGDIY
jgi:hypothetical protein